ncbi:MAG TPA: hypothetical protein VHN11_21860 [Xanthobacteraceae bacterium]|jgi:hypothetical protein|nr:hypothetical protein [Xanthobacteraceae bacterium]
MAQFEGFRLHTIRLPLWRIVLIAGLVLGLVAVVALVMLGFLLVAIPAALIAGVAYHLFGRAKRRRASPKEGMIIEADYQVIETKSLDRERPTH